MRKWGIAFVMLAGVALGSAACGGDGDKLASDKQASDKQASEAQTRATEAGAPASSDENGEPGDNTLAARVDSVAEDDLGAPPLLSGAGIGEIQFGAADDMAVAELTTMLGRPTSDTGWVPTSSPCDDVTTQTRDVQFGDLWTEFADAPDDFGSGKHFRSYILMSPEGAAVAAVQFKTDKGVAIGMTAAEAQASDPGFEVSDSEIAGRIWASGEPGRTVNGAIFNDGTYERVSSIGAGVLCVD